MTKIASGEKLMEPSQPSLNEKLEIQVWQMVLKHIGKEKRIDGKVAYVVKKSSVRDLVVGIIEFYEQYKKSK